MKSVFKAPGERLVEFTRHDGGIYVSRWYRIDDPRQWVLVVREGDYEYREIVETKPNRAEFFAFLNRAYDALEKAAAPELPA